MKTDNNRNFKYNSYLKLFLILPVIFTLNSCQKDDTPETPAEGTAPDFTLTSLEGMDVMLSDYKGKVVVLFFFGNSCPSCKAAAPSVQSMLVTPFADRSDYKIMGLDQWNGNPASVESFKSVTGVTFSLLLNASKVAADYKTTYDRLVVVDQKGDISFSGTQGAAADIADVKKKVESLLGTMR